MTKRAWAGRRAEFWGRSLTICCQESRQPWKPLRPYHPSSPRWKKLRIWQLGISSRREERRGIQKEFKDRDSSDPGDKGDPGKTQGCLVSGPRGVRLGGGDLMGRVWEIVKGRVRVSFSLPTRGCMRVLQRNRINRINICLYVCVCTYKCMYVCICGLLYIDR